MTTVCVICDEKMNKNNHTKVACPYCAYEACRSCCETYILGQSIPKCMDGKCGKEWTRKFLVQTFTKAFINGAWKKNVEKKLLDKEVALLPATQGVVESLIQKEKAMEEARELDRQIKEMERRRRNLLYEANQGAVFVAKEKHFVRSCPSAECRGYLSSQWKCGLCELWTCPDCHVVKGLDKDAEHVCNADELATAKLLDKDTKPCPKCSTGIFKIEGCDQMWCTQCHTAFSWKTGHIETHIHNPHFFEWQRKNGGLARAPGDILCGREITHYMPNTFRDILKGVNVDSKWSSSNAIEIFNQLSHIVRNLLHLTRVQTPTFRVNNMENNQELRVKYMRKEIDLETFKSRIHRDNKKFEKKREIHEILTMFSQTVTDIIFRVQDLLIVNREVFTEVLSGNATMSKEAKTNKRIEVEQETFAIFRELETIRAYANECLYEISQTYGSKPKQIISLTEKNAIDILVDVVAFKADKVKKAEKAEMALAPQPYLTMR